MPPDVAEVDLVGIGAGPFNLSLAALIREAPELSSRFLERQPRLAWHPGLAFADARLQTSFLKDLVTPVRPTSPWSFVNYLVEHGRFFDFLAARRQSASRVEFTDYLAWAAERLPNVTLGREAMEVDHAEGVFRVRLDDGAEIRARALSIGVGQAPNVPSFAPLGPRCLHASRYLTERPSLAGRRVALVGGGQSGAEVMLDLLTREDGPERIVWISRRDGFWTLQEGGFVDQFFTPAYQAAYRASPPEARKAALGSQKYASDGITPETADAIYQALYGRRHLEGRDDAALMPGREVVDLRRRGGGFGVVTRAADGVVEEIGADLVVLATGYRPAAPVCLEPLRSRLEIEPDGALRLGERYRVVWDGPEDAPIYALNHGRRAYGVVDPQLSMAAWRSAIICNDLAGRDVFDLEAGRAGGLVQWRPERARAQAPAAAPVVALKRVGEWSA